MDELPHIALINETEKTRALEAVLFTQCRFLRLVNEDDAYEHVPRVRQCVDRSACQQYISEKFKTDVRLGLFAWKRSGCLLLGG